jgi:quinol monooxygenase YgiN
MNQLLIIAVAVILFVATSAGARAAEIRYVATYLDVKLASTNAGAALSKQYVRATRAEAGSVWVYAFQEIGRSNRYVIVESWVDSAAFGEHEKAPDTVEFRRK